MDLGVAVGHVVAVAVGIEEQVRRIQHPDAPAPVRHGGRDVQAVHERLVPVVDAVAIGILVDRDLILAAEMVGRGRGDLVVDGPPDPVVADHPQARGKRILQVLHHPEPPAFVEVDRDRLPDDRLGQDELELEVVGDLEAGQGRAGRERRLAAFKRDVGLRRSGRHAAFGTRGGSADRAPRGSRCGAVFGTRGSRSRRGGPATCRRPALALGIDPRDRLGRMAGDPAHQERYGRRCQRVDLVERALTGERRLDPSTIGTGFLSRPRLIDRLEVVTVMPGVMAAEHVRVERRPLGVSRGGLARGYRTRGRPCGCRRPVCRPRCNGG